MAIGIPELEAPGHDCIESGARDDAKLAFLTYGPMMDVKLIFLYQTVLKKRFILLTAVGLFLAIGSMSILWQHLFYQAS